MLFEEEYQEEVIEHMHHMESQTIAAVELMDVQPELKWFMRPYLVDFLIEMGFQTWSRGFTPRDIVGYWLPRAVEVDIRIGDVIIAPGDYLLGDRDGMVRIPRAQVADVVEQAEAAIGTENKVRTAILGGMDPQQAYLEFGKF